MLPLAAGRNEGGHYFGLSGVHALPLAAGFWGVPLFKTPEGVVVGFQIFAWAPN